MLSRPIDLSQKDAQAHTHIQVTPNSQSQYGISQNNYPTLLNVPIETLTGITSYLDPPSLFALAQVDKHFHRHVEDDNTWRHAFVRQFFGVGPEGSLDDDTIILLRRIERSWRQEFITRHVLIRRWNRSRNVTTAHVPVHSNISGMRLMTSQALLTSSITYGIVARSLPLTGKVLSGFLDASGVRGGLGIGNPNAEFTPDVSSCATTSDGGTAKVAWGSRAGHLTFTFAPRAMETSRRSAADIKRCSAADQHVGAVSDVQWVDAQANWVVSGAADSCVKLWDAKAASCIWTSEATVIAFVPDACLKVNACHQHGFIASVHESGDIRLWIGFDFKNPTHMTDDVKALVIKSPIRRTTEGYDPELAHGARTLSIDPTNAFPTILVLYQNDCYFYRVRVDPTTAQAEVVTFGDPFFGLTSIVVPYFRSDQASEQSSFVLVGDHMGCVSLYAWDADVTKVNQSTQAIPPLRKFEAHPDGASVTAIAWNGVTLVTGSVRGATYAFDALDIFSITLGIDPTEREQVRHILLSSEKDTVFVAVGDHILAWRAGLVPKQSQGGVRGRHSGGALGKRKALNPKYIEQMELKQTIQESKSILNEESKYSKKYYSREEEHRRGFNQLGLSEAEAVEYVLMLSRDEASSRAALEASSSTKVLEEEEEEGIILGDFDDDDVDSDIESHLQREQSLASTASSRRPSSSNLSGFSTPSNPSSQSASSKGGSVSSHRSGMTTTKDGKPIPRVAPAEPGSNEKIRVSPPYREEPMEAGPEYFAEDGPSMGTRMHIEDHYFPPISATVSASTSPVGNSSVYSLASGKSVSPPNGVSPSSVKRAGSGGSPESPVHVAASAWSVPLRTRGTSSSSGSVSSAWGGLSRALPPVLVSGQQQRQPLPQSTTSSFDDMDDDLRFALEISLVEARSRGEDV